MITPITIMSKHWYNFNNDQENIKNKNNKNVVIVISICEKRISMTIELNIMSKWR